MNLAEMNSQKRSKDKGDQKGDAECNDDVQQGGDVQQGSMYTMRICVTNILSNNNA